MADLSPDAVNSRERPPAAGGIGLYSAIAIGIGGMVEFMSNDGVFSNVRMKARMDGILQYPTLTEGLPTLIEWYRREKQEK